MENQTSFDLSDAIQKWRRNLAQSDAFDSNNLDELEAHLRDAIPALQAAGLSSEESFLIASRRIGARDALESEFGKINARRAWLNRPIVPVLALALEVVLILVIVGLAKGITEETTRRTTGVGAELMVQAPGCRCPSGDCREFDGVIDRRQIARITWSQGRSPRDAQNEYPGWYRSPLWN